MENLKGIKRVKLALINDIDGDCATDLILLAESGEEAKKISENLRENKVPAGGIYDIRDWHIYRS